MNEIIAYKDELLLLRWSENSRDGQTVTFQLPGEYEAHPFKGHPFGKQTGRRYAAVLVEIGDDEKPVVQKGGPLSKEAAGLCKRRDFQLFVNDETHGEYVANEEDAARFIRHFCVINSRAELDHDIVAAARFSRLKDEYSRGKA